MKTLALELLEKYYKAEADRLWECRQSDKIDLTELDKEIERYKERIEKYCKFRNDQKLINDQNSLFFKDQDDYIVEFNINGDDLGIFLDNRDDDLHQSYCKVNLTKEQCKDLICFLQELLKRE